MSSVSYVRIGVWQIFYSQQRCEPYERRSVGHKLDVLYDVRSEFEIIMRGVYARVGVATDEEIAMVHTEAFIDATKRAGHGERGDWSRFGYGPGDNPIFRNMHEAGAAVAGASIVAAQRVLEGDADHAFNAAGGLHHAMPDRASGFCVYDDPAIAITWMLANGAERIPRGLAAAHGAFQRGGDGEPEARADRRSTPFLDLRARERRLRIGRGEPLAGRRPIVATASRAR